MAKLRAHTLFHITGWVYSKLFETQVLPKDRIKLRCSERDSTVLHA